MAKKVSVGKDAKIVKAIREIDRSIAEWQEIYDSDLTDKSLCLGINMLKGFRQRLIDIRDDKPVNSLTYREKERLKKKNNKENKLYQDKGTDFNE